MLPQKQQPETLLLDEDVSQQRNTYRSKDQGPVPKVFRWRQQRAGNWVACQQGKRQGK